MNKLSLLSSASILTLALSACGGGDGGSSNQSVNVPENEAFSDITTPNDFEWRGVNRHQITLNVVSAISTQEGEPVSIRGKHIVTLFAITESGTSNDAFFSGMTNQDGVIIPSIELPTSWQGVQFQAQVRGETCTLQLDADEITDEIDLACNIVLSAD